METANTVVTKYQLSPNLTIHPHRKFQPNTWLVIGTGPTVGEDWAQLLSLAPEDFFLQSELVLVNGAALPLGCTRADHHVTYHSEHYHVVPTETVRSCRSRHASVAMPWTTDCWLVPDEYHVGGSAFLAAYIAGQLGHIRRVVLIGCPMDGDDAHAVLLQQVLNSQPEVWKYYRRLVCSLSGATKDLFGGLTTLTITSEEY